MLAVRQTTELVCEAMLNLSILSCSRANIVDAGAMAVLANVLSNASTTPPCPAPPAPSVPRTASFSSGSFAVEMRVCVANIICNLSSMRVNQASPCPPISAFFAWLTSWNVM